MISVIDLQDLYKTYFNKQPYYITPKGSHLTPEGGISQDVVFSGIPENQRSKGSIDNIHKGKFDIALNKVGAYGHDIWFPIKFVVNKHLSLEIDACTIAVNLSKTIVRTAVSERKGTVKECFAVDDYKFTIKGFLIGKNRMYPEDQINALKNIFESTEPVELHGGYPEMFLDDSCRVAIATLDFPEVQGKSPWIKPFSLTCESDFIQDLILP